MFCRASNSGDVPLLSVQLEAFDTFKAMDDEQSPGAAGVDLSSHMDVFNAIYKQVSIMVTCCILHDIVRVGIHSLLSPVPSIISNVLAGTWHYD